MELSYLIGDGIQVSGAFCKGGWVQDVFELSIQLGKYDIDEFDLCLKISLNIFEMMQ